jgi:hypothetical protein
MVGELRFAICIGRAPIPMVDYIALDAPVRRLSQVVLMYRESRARD